MTQDDLGNFIDLMRGMADVYDNQLSERKIEIYFNALKDLPFEEVYRVGNQLCQSSKFFPRPVEFRQQLLPDLETQASLAYDKVKKAFYDHGVYKSIVFDDPVIHAVMDSLGGWVEYCTQSEYQLVFWRKDFEKKYLLYAPRIAQMEPRKVMTGLYAENGKSTDRAKAFRYVGDKKTALEWTDQNKLTVGENKLTEGEVVGVVTR